jgi:hypothetical protein
MCSYLRAQEKSVSLWSIIRDNVGKDLSRVCLPVYFNEPLSALQKLAEDMEYSGLLDQARGLFKFLIRLWYILSLLAG